MKDSQQVIKKSPSAKRLRRNGSDTLISKIIKFNLKKKFKEKLILWRKERTGFQDVMIQQQRLLNEVLRVLMQQCQTHSKQQIMKEQQMHSLWYNNSSRCKFLWDHSVKHKI